MNLRGTRTNAYLISSTFPLHLKVLMPLSAIKFPSSLFALNEKLTFRLSYLLLYVL